MGDVTYQDRVLGCLLGGAIGDALGAPVEFWSEQQIRARVGDAGVREYLPATFGDVAGLGLITDDTQMTLFTVEGLIRAQIRYAGKGICHPPAVIHHAYLRWLTTQEHTGPPRTSPHDDAEDDETDLIDGWLGHERWLYSQRAPGMTCLSALRASHRQASFGFVARNDSKGCGGVMRSAPFGLAHLIDPGQMGMECAAITHGHPTGQVASGALAVLIASIVDDDADLDTALDSVDRWLDGTPNSEETRAALRHARTLANSRRPGAASLPLLGEGWVAEEALAIAVFAALVHPGSGQVLDALALAVSHSGDSDSTGAICGNILGALHGPASLPEHLVDGVEGREVIEQLARDLVDVMSGAPGVMEPTDLTPGVLRIPDVSREWAARYPGW